jgi:hypothetical protein
MENAKPKLQQMKFSKAAKTLEEISELEEKFEIELEKGLSA